MKISGETTKGDLVCGGYWTLYASHGVSLEDILQFKKNEIDWHDFFMSAAKDGVNIPRLERKVYSAVCETFGKNYALEYLQAFNRYKSAFDTLSKQC